jgi:hypothetical protein
MFKFLKFKDKKMKLIKIQNDNGIGYAEGMPKIPNPVEVYLDVRNVNLALDNDPNTKDGWLIRKNNKESPVDKSFAEIALSVLEDWCQKLGYDGIAHIGVFNSRMARTISGQSLGRPSNHATARAIDFKGFVLVDKFIHFKDVPEMNEIISTMKALAKTNGFFVEELVEGKVRGKVTKMSWYHIGIYPSSVRD